MPITVGVPTVPNDTGVVFAMSATITAARAGNPSDNNKGATSAAGTPNPAAPSTNPPNNQAIIIVCTLLSGEIVEKPWLITSNAPLSFKVKSSVNAPNTISMIFNITTTPLSPDASTHVGGVFHINSANITVIANATGIAFTAGQRKPTISTKIATRGRAASSARIPSVMISGFIKLKF